MNTERIGRAAGAIWNKLNSKAGDGIGLTELKKVPGCSAEEAIAGIGWLAREGKLCFETQGKKLIVKLAQVESYV